VLEVVKAQDKLLQALARFPWFADHAMEQLHPDEYELQSWWTDELDLSGLRVNILNSGFGVYAVPLAFAAGAESVHLYDMDPLAKKIAYELHGHNPNFTHAIADIVFDPIVLGDADVWVNTSCEHNYGTMGIIRLPATMVLAGNDIVKRGHINPIESCDDLAEQYGMTHISKQISFEHQHMVIGK
jgi:hypothetical protein